MKLGTNSAIFILFFGVALIEAIQLNNWLWAIVFIGLGIISYRSDRKTKK